MFILIMFSAPHLSTSVSTFAYRKKDVLAAEEAARRQAIGIDDFSRVMWRAITANTYWIHDNTYKMS